MDQTSKTGRVCAWMFWLFAGAALLAGLWGQYRLYSAFVSPGPYPWSSWDDVPGLSSLVWSLLFSSLEDVLYPALILATIGTACRLLGDIQPRLAARGGGVP